MEKRRKVKEATIVMGKISLHDAKNKLKETNKKAGYIIDALKCNKMSDGTVICSVKSHRMK